MLELLNRKSSDVLSLGAGSLAQQFVPRADGDFDFFPRGMRKTGYRVDSELQARIMRLERGPDGLFVGLIFIIVLITVAAQPLLQFVLPLGGLWLTLAGAVVTSIALLTSRRGVHRMTLELLRDAPVVHMTEEGYRQLVARRWRELPPRRLLLNLLLMLVPAVLFSALATGEIPVPTWQRLLAIPLTLLFWVGLLQMALEIIRVRRWSRALR